MEKWESRHVRLGCNAMRFRTCSLETFAERNGKGDIGEVLLECSYQLEAGSLKLGIFSPDTYVVLIETSK